MSTLFLNALAISKAHRRLTTYVVLFINKHIRFMYRKYNYHFPVLILSKVES